MPWTIERFTRHHDRTGFSCGQPQLDDFLTRSVSQYEKRNIGRTYVLIRDAETKVLGFYTLAASQVQFVDLPPEAAKQIPKHPIPTLLLGRLAVDQSVRGRGLGEMLLRDALARTLALSEQVGIFAVVVDAINDEAVRFYERHGFLRFVGHPNRLFVTVNTIRQSGGG